MNTAPHAEHGTVKTYLYGFVLSLALTIAAFELVDRQILSGMTLILTVLGLGALQTVIQLILFLHLGQESKPRTNFMVFLFMLLVLVILVLCSLWIMNNLNYRMM